MKQIPLTNYGYALVDDEDYDRVSEFKWYSAEHSNGRYVLRTQLDDGRNVYLHRFILNNPNGDTDHINHDALDNRKSNLRIVSRSQNLRNQRPRDPDTKTSQYKGVCRASRGKTWQVYISHNKQRYYLGRFEDEIDAALAYDNAAIRLYGDYAYTNQMHFGVLN